MEEQNIDVNEAELVESEITDESESSADEQINDAVVEETESDGSEAVETPEEETDTPSDLPKSEKGLNRVQQLANERTEAMRENAELKEKLAALERSSEISKRLNHAEEFKAAFESNAPVIDPRTGMGMYDQFGNPVRMQDVPEYKLNYLQAKIDANEFSQQLASERNKILEADAKAAAIEQKTPILKKGHPDFSEGALNSYHKLIKTYEPDEALSIINDIYGSAKSKGLAVKQANIVSKQSQDIGTGSKPVNSSSKNPQDMEPEELKAYILSQQKQ